MSLRKQRVNWKVEKKDLTCVHESIHLKHDCTGRVFLSNLVLITAWCNSLSKRSIICSNGSRTWNIAWCWLVTVTSSYIIVILTMVIYIYIFSMLFRNHLRRTYIHALCLRFSTWYHVWGIRSYQIEVYTHTCTYSIPNVNIDIRIVATNSWRSLTS